MSQLAPCPACNRHVATIEAACPFCATALPDSFRQRTPARRPPGRLSRAALLAASAALLAAEACTDDVIVAPAYGAPAPDAAIDSGAMDSAVALYGAAPLPLETAPADPPPTPPAQS